MNEPVVIRLSKDDRTKLAELTEKVTQLAHECGIELTYERALTTAFWCAAYGQPLPIPCIAEAVVRHDVKAEWDSVRKGRLNGNKPIAVIYDELDE